MCESMVILEFSRDSLNFDLSRSIGNIMGSSSPGIGICMHSKEGKRLIKAALRSSPSHFTYGNSLVVTYSLIGMAAPFESLGTKE